MAHDDEFDLIVKRSQRVLRLNDQYENHPFVEEFTKGRSVMFVYGTYVLEGEADAKVSLGDIWKLFQRDILHNNASNIDKTLHGSGTAVEKGIMLQIKKATEASGGDLMCYVFSLEDAVAYLSVNDPDGILTIEK